MLKQHNKLTQEKLGLSRNGQIKTEFCGRSSFLECWDNLTRFVPLRRTFVNKFKFFWFVLCYDKHRHKMDFVSISLVWVSWCAPGTYGLSGVHSMSCDRLFHRYGQKNYVKTLHAYVSLKAITSTCICKVNALHIKAPLFFWLLVSPYMYLDSLLLPFKLHRR